MLRRPLPAGPIYAGFFVARICSWPPLPRPVNPPAAPSSGRVAPVHGDRVGPGGYPVLGGHPDIKESAITRSAA